ncbi:hypothetical protein, partial [Flavobacterium sp. 7A]|uniref:hypothetical protein n=1 Tax=Flavobacterium sp. 7A TaxID=2940571 RepID=UPI0022262D99
MKENYTKIAVSSLKLSQFKFILLTMFLLLFSTMANAQFGVGGANSDNGDLRLNYEAGKQNDVLALSSTGTTNTVTITSIKPAPQQLHSMKVKMQLPPGVLYTAGTVIITDNNNATTPITGTFVLQEADISDLNAPVFSIYNNGNETDLWAGGDFVTFSYERTANCDAVTFKENKNSFKDNATITYVKTKFAGVQTAVDVNPLIGNYQLLAASLSIQSIPSVDGIVGGNHTRTVTDVNGGNAGVAQVTHTVIVGSSITNHTLSYTTNGGTTAVTTVMTPNSSTTDASGVTTKTYIINLSDALYTGGATGAGGIGENGDGDFGAGESLVFTEDFSVADCDDVAITHKVEWTCQSSKIAQGGVLFGANAPQLVLAVEQNQNNITGLNHKKIRITNTGSGPAAFGKDILINVGLGVNGALATTTYGNNPHWGPTKYNVRSYSNFTLGDGTTQVAFTPDEWESDRNTFQGTNTFILPPDKYTSDIDGAGGLTDSDLDGFFDDLPAGASVVIEFDYVNDPRTNCGIGRFDYMQWEHMYVDVLTKDQCAIARPTVGKDLGYLNFIRDYTVPTITEQDTDIVELVPFEVAIRPYVYSIFQHNDHAMLNNNADSQFTVSITVPRGVDLITTPGFSQVDGSYTVGAVGAGTNVITYTTTNLANGYVIRDFADFFARFPLVMNCAELELGGVNNTINITYETNLTLFNATSGVALSRDIHCGNFEPIIEHSCNTPCAGPNIKSLDAYRVTAGWTNNNMTDKVDLTEKNTDGTPKYELDKYLAGDEMVVETTGEMNNLSSNNLHFIQDYITDGTTAGANDIKFVSGTIVITKKSGTATLELQLIAPTVTSSGNSHSLDFDMSSALSGTLVGGLIEDGDKFLVKFKYQFTTDTYTNYNYHILSGFRGRYYVRETLPAGANAGAVDNDNDNDGITNERISCFDWGDQVAYLRPFNVSYGVANSTFKYCETVWTNLLNDYVLSNSGHLHPGEYRPVTQIKSTEIVVPKGVTILDIRQYNNSGVNGAIAYYTLSGGALNISPALGTATDNKYTITPNRAGGYRDHDQTSNASYRMQILVKGSCELKDQVKGAPLPTITSTSIVQHLAYTEVPLASQLLTRIPSARLTYTKPAYIFQPINAIVIGYGPEAELDLRVVNNSAAGGNVDYNWIKMPATANAYVTSAIDIANPGTPLNIVKVGNDSYIEIGSINAGATKNVRVKATYDSCTDIPVNFSLGWNCDAYPADYSAVTDVCYDDSATITIQPAEGQIQQSITQQPVAPVALCSSFDIEVEYSSAQVGTIINPKSLFKLFNGTKAVTINKIESQYPATTGAWEDITANVTTSGSDTYVIPITHGALTPIFGGIPGTGAVGPSVNDRKVIVRYNLSTTCDYVSNSPISFTILGDKSCGKPSIGNGSRAVTAGIKVNGLEPTYDALSIISLPDFANPNGAHIDGCSAEELVTVNTTISAFSTDLLATTGDNDYGRVELPIGVTYAEGTFLNSGANEVTFVSSTPNQLIVKYPAGLKDQDKTEFTFEIIPRGGYCADDAEVTYLTYVENSDGIFCGTSLVPCGPSLIATGNTRESLDIKKAAVVISMNSAISTVAVSGETVTANFKLSNTSAINITPPSKVSAYYDSNTNGVYDSGVDVLLGSQSFNTPIPANTSINEQFSFTATPTQICNILLVLNVDENPCICLPASVAMGSPTVLAGIGGGNVSACELNTTKQIGGTPNADYTYSWAGATPATTAYLDNLTVANPNFTYAGANITVPTVISYTVTITRAGGCKSTDVVDVTVLPSADLPVISSSSLSVCTNEFLSIEFGNTLATNETYKLYKNAALTTPANLPTSRGQWKSTELYAAGPGTLYVTIENTVTGCVSPVLVVPYTIIACNADLVTTKTVDNKTPVEGGTVKFTLSVTNNGPNKATNVSLADKMPTGLTYVSDNGGSTYNSGTGIWSIGTMLVDAVVSLEITATVNAGTTGKTINNVTTAATGEQPDPTNDGNDLNESVTVNRFPVVANDDKLNQTAGPVTVSILADNGYGADTDPEDGAIVSSTINLITPTNAVSPVVVGGNVVGFTVPNQGVWSLDATGVLTFTPCSAVGPNCAAIFTANPTPIKYTAKDSKGDISNQATVTITYEKVPPTAVDDLSLANIPNTSVVVNPIPGTTGQDNDPDGIINPATVSLVIPSGATSIVVDSNGDVTSLDVPGEGKWSVNPTTGVITFTPLPTFHKDPTPIFYNVEDNDGNQSNNAKVTIDYLPIATKDDSLANPSGSPVVVNVLANDVIGDTVDPTTVSIAGETSPGVKVVVGEGTWTVNPTTGAITFAPCTTVSLPNC